MEELIGRAKNYIDLAVEDGYITEGDRDYFFSEMSFLDNMTQELIYNMIETVFQTVQEH